MSELLFKEQEPFRVQDDQTAEWCLRKIKEEEEEADRLIGWYNRQIEATKKRLEERSSYFKGLLEDYFPTVPFKESKTMYKYSLPSADLVYTKEKTDYKAADKEKLLSWCITNDPELIKVESSPKWAEIKKRLTTDAEGKIVDSETGLFVDGVELETKPQQFQIRGRE